MTTNEEDFSSDMTGMPKTVEEEDTEPSSVLAALESELSKEIERPALRVTVKEREQMAVEFDTNIGTRQIRQWRRNSGENTKNGLDSVKFAMYVVGDRCRGIYFNDKLVTNDDDVAINFASAEMREMTDADDPWEAMKWVYGVDAHIEATALLIIEAAGYGDEVDAEDPTDQL